MNPYIENRLEEYHVVSRNSKALAYIKNLHLTHYRNDILKLKNVVVKHEGYSIQLPHAIIPKTGFDEILRNRKSQRDFEEKKISLQELSNLLFIGYGSYYDQNRASEKKFVPSSGGLNSVELYIVVLSSNDVPEGIYHYDSKQHLIVSLSSGNYKTWLKENVFYQEEFPEASLVIVLTSSVGKLSKKYGVRAYRLALLDVGHVSQNIYLASSALKLKACASAGFIDDELDNALNLDGLENASFLTIMIG